jgi:polyhydroxybutyrate depolymerase
MRSIPKAPTCAVTLALLAAVGLGCNGGGAAGTGGGAAGTAAASSAAGSNGTAGDEGSAAGATGAAAGISGGAAGTNGAAGTGSGGTAGSGAPGDAGTSSDAGTDSFTGPTGAWPGRMMPTGPSAGCGIAPAQTLATYVKHDITVTGLKATDVAMYGSRNYYLRLPTGYNPARKYTTVFLGPGCGGNGSQVIPVQNASMGDAIIVGLSPVGQCFETNGQASPEIPFFDAVLAEVEGSVCVDKARVFVAGFSSGSWLTNNLSCARAGIIRGQGNATGGEPGNQGTCTGPVAAMLAHDTTDTANKIEGGEAARDRIRKLNGCGDDTLPYDAGTPSPCVIYQGCMPGYPVVWCATTGKGHSDQIPISTTGFWKFWSSLP